MNRRNFLNLSAVSAAAFASRGCSVKTVQSKSILDKQLRSAKSKPRVVIVGGGFGGLNTASAIKQNDPQNKIEVIVLEKNPTYFVCPMSNTLLSGDSTFKKDDFIFNYANVQLEYKFDVIHSEVLDIDRAHKSISTTQGILEYDYLVLALGISYDYKVEFPTWSDSGVEHAILISQLEKFKQNGGKGEIVIILPRTRLIKDLNKSVKHKSLMRCKLAAYERACMIGDWIKRNDL